MATVIFLHPSQEGHSEEIQCDGSKTGHCQRKKCGEPIAFRLQIVLGMVGTRLGQDAHQANLVYKHGKSFLAAAGKFERFQVFAGDQSAIELLKLALGIIIDQDLPCFRETCFEFRGDPTGK
jgi:hypothetical protein